MDWYRNVSSSNLYWSWNQFHSYFWIIYNKSYYRLNFMSIGEINGIEFDVIIILNMLDSLYINSKKSFYYHNDFIIHWTKWNRIIHFHIKWSIPSSISKSSFMIFPYKSFNMKNRSSNQLSISIDITFHPYKQIIPSNQTYLKYHENDIESIQTCIDCRNRE